MKKFFKNKVLLTFLMIFFVGMQVFGGLLFPEDVKALGLGVPQLSIDLTNLPYNIESAAQQTVQTTNQVAQNVKDNADSALLSAALGSLVSGASYFMRKLAYDSAKYIASGGKGQGALAFDQGFGDYLLSTAGDAATTAIDSFGAANGLNLCKPTNIGVLKDLQISLNRIYNDAKYLGESAGSGNLVGNTASGSPNGAPQTKCKWSDFKQNWQELPDMFGKDAISERFANSLDSVQSDLGIALTALTRLDTIVSNKKEAAANERLEGSGFKSVKDTISNAIKTPGSFIYEESKSTTANQQGQQSAQQLAGLYGSNSWAIIGPALGIFANTLVSDLLKQVFTKGIIPNKGGNALDYTASTLATNRQAADNVFSFLVAGLPQRNLSSYDIITQYSSCPDNPGLNNCVMDSALVQALERARSGDPLTIKEAIDTGLLHGDWQMIPPSDIVDNTDLNCYRNAYCYSNIQKMRKARILPLGFEIAALKSNPDEPWTLQQFVDGYNNCSSDLIADSTFPFCHLIDPNWILKAPEAICEAQVYGPQLASASTGQRKEECVDFSTCLAYSATGECKSFGYCTQETNIWDMPGKSCPAEYATCKTYTAQDGKVASYLSRTLDYGTCNIGSVGCSAYSTIQNNDGKWIGDIDVDLALQADGYSQALYFNEKIDNYTCPESSNGCSLFIYPTTTQEVYLKKAPSYLGCYDTDPNSSDTIEWPKNKSDLTKLADSPESCSDFAQVCLPEEVGCEAYTPQNGGATLTGVVGDNYCPSQCVGYETFKQESTAFEESQFPLYFIPDNGQSCAPQYAGCDEFTNIGSTSGETLEYYSDLKYCQQPTNDNAKIYYSWEGSDSQGYVLKKHSLLQIDDVEKDYLDTLALDTEVANSFKIGSPAYVKDDADTLENNYLNCNAENYDILIHNPYRPEAANPDCRALYDDADHVYYRLLADTVTVSDQCQPLKKTIANFVDAPGLNQSLCDSKGGKWDGGSCQLCSNGGTYDETGNFCKYWSIASEAESCPAVVNGCRLYIGNTGNNIHEIYSTSFEPVGNDADALASAKVNWGNGSTDNSISVQPEATQVGLYSLKVTGGSTKLTLSSNQLQRGSWYELSFWARGDSTKLDIYFGQDPDAGVGNFTIDPLTGASVPVGIGFDWQEYKLGPVMFNPNSDGDYVINFAGISGATTYFIDNVRLVSMGDNPNDYVPLIKDSWKTSEGYNVSTACDSTPLDAYPGEYLGCRTYSDSNGTNVNLTGFQNLCRAEAVGCTGLLDTGNLKLGNYSGSNYLIYNALCIKGNDITADICGLDIDSDGQDDYSCQLEKGQTECHIAGPIKITSSMSSNNPFDLASTAPTAGTSNDVVYTDISTVVVPVTDVNNPDLVYLTVNNQYLCSKNYLGCTEVGLQHQVLPNPGQAASYEYESKFILNNVDNYSETLCTQEQIACEQFKSDNTVSFFKDPAKSGPLCVYQEATKVSGQNASGWFFDGIGRCASSATGSIEYCRKDDDCATDVKCIDIGSQACYPTYLNGDNQYGLWSNASDAYAGHVGVCNATYNQCTELVDPIDDTSYYVIADDNLFSNTDVCDGKVSQTDGCVLFDKTENPNKFYDSVATYNKNRDENFLPVPPETVDATQGDANLLLKVNRDRQCGEWLACRSSKIEIDSNGVPQEVCLEYKTCNKMGADGKCASDGWSEDNLDTTKLTETKYIQKAQNDFNIDYSGYSLFNKYNINNYVYLLFPNHSDAYLAYQINDRVFGSGEYAANGCVSTGAVTKHDGDICGIDQGGRCYSQKCLYPISGSFTNDVLTVDNSASQEDQQAVISENVENMLPEMIPGTCKSYPEVNSPFDVSIAINGDPSSPDNTNIKKNENITNSPIRSEYKSIKQQFTQSKLCQFDDTTSGDCSCDYVKVEYANGTTDYWSRNTSSVIPEGVCTGTGDINGLPCNTDNDCKQAGQENGYGVCNKQKSQGTYIGLKGLCLEKDLSRPLATISTGEKTYQDFACLTWLPIQESATAYDLYNQNVEAGYYPIGKYDSAQGGVSYCIQSTAFGKGYYDPQFDFGPQISGVDQIKDVPINYEITEWVNDNNGSAFGGGNMHTVTSTISTPYSDIFKLNTSYYSDDDSAGVDGYGNKYSTLISSQDKTKIYKTMQLWGWKNLSTTSRLLRVDLKNIDARYEMSYKYSSIPNILDQDEDVAPRAVFGFALAMDDSDAEDTGTIMHPPRFGWYPVPKEETVFSYFMDTNRGGTSDLTLVESTPFSPDISDDNNPYLYTDREVEQNLNEFMLNRVYFVPIYFPMGAEGNNPSTLNNNYYIDFNKLRAGLAKGTPYDINSIDATSGNKTLSTASSFGGTKNFQYVLQRKNSSSSCDENGLLSYCNYDGVLDVQTFCNDDNSAYYCNNAQNFTSGTSGENYKYNQIYRRYVALFFDKDSYMTGHPFPFGASSGLALPTRNDLLGNNTDPFTTACEQGKSNWLAIGMDFNEDGEFLGYISRWCNGANNEDTEDNGINFATFADLQNVCLDVASVVNKSSENLNDYNKAWTDRVWRGAAETFKIWNGTSFANWAYNQTKRSTNLMPFMSLAGSVINEDSLSKTFEELSPAVKYYGFPDDKLGLPYLCDGTVFQGDNKSIFSVMNACEGIDSDNQSLIANLSAQNATAIFSIPNPKSKIQDLFKKFYTEWNLKSGELITTNLDVSGENLGLTREPQVFALNYTTCSSSGILQTDCKSAGPGFTINNRNYRMDNYDDVPGADEDLDNSGAVDPIIAENSYEATAKFFGFADDNRMPIKRALVNWDDGSDIYSRIGSSKNRKPYCAGPDVGRCTTRPEGQAWQEGDSQLTCTEDSDCLASLGVGYRCDKSDAATSHFGDQDRACTEGYFELSHTYYCDPDPNIEDNKYTLQQILDNVVVNDFNGMRLFANTADAKDAYDALLGRRVGEGARILQPGDKVCVFKPGVQILDNWGWCNGSCTSGYTWNSDYRDDTGNQPTGSMINSCYSNKYVINGGLTVNQCSSTFYPESRDPWTYYRGSIIVIP